MNTISISMTCARGEIIRYLLDTELSDVKNVSTYELISAIQQYPRTHPVDIFELFEQSRLSYSMKELMTAFTRTKFRHDNIILTAIPKYNYGNIYSTLSCLLVYDDNELNLLKLKAPDHYNEILKKYKGLVYES